jgi:hypothetical protein
MALVGAPGQAEGPPAPPPIVREPEVQVVAFLDPLMRYSASVAYRKRVSEAVAKADLARLASELGLSGIDELRPTDDDGKKLPITYKEEDGGCQLAFRLSERALRRDQGTFVLEPFITAWRPYRRIDLDFAVGGLGGQPFVYRGVRHHDDRFVRLRHRGQDASHSFVVEVTDPSYQRLALPTFAPPEAARQVDGRNARSPSPLVEWLGVLAVALGSGMAAFGVFSVLLRRRPRKGRGGGARS